MNKLYVELFFIGGKLKKKSKDKLKCFMADERGGADPVIVLLFAAIVILAVLALKPTIDAALASFGTSFSTWLGNKATSTFQ